MYNYTVRHLFNMPCLLLALIIAITACGSFIPIYFKSLFYSISLFLKSIIIFILPFIIFSLLFKTLVKTSKSILKIIVLLLILICISNFLSTNISYIFAKLIYAQETYLSTYINTNSVKLDTIWTLNLTSIFSNDIALFFGLIAGTLGALLQSKVIYKAAHYLDVFSTALLRFITTILPLFIAGFIFKLEHEGMIAQIMQNYIIVLGIIIAAQFSYIFLMYFLAAGCNIKLAVTFLRNMFASAVAGFSTMSSATAMSLTIPATYNNAKLIMAPGDAGIIKSIIPTTVNVHLVGDCFAIPILAYAILKTYGFAEPHFMNYVTFALFFVIAKFSVAAIPGGGIIVMLPILQTHFNFSAEMMSLITTLYVFFDPIVTCANVLGNGSFALLMARISKHI